MRTSSIRTLSAIAAWLLIGAMLTQSVAAQEQQRASVRGDRDFLLMGETGSLEVPLYRSRILRLDAPVTRVSIGNPDIADILIIRATQVYVLGKSLGTTNVLLWDRNDNMVGTVNVEVTHDLETLRAKLHTLMPDERIEVHSAQRSIVLRGQVTSATNMDVALEVARNYLMQTRGGEDGSRVETRVINQLQVAGAQQVMLQVTVAEISRTLLKRLDSQFNAIDVGADQWIFGGVSGGSIHPGVGFQIQPVPKLIQRTGLFASYLGNTFLFDWVLDVAKENGMAKILAEPTLTTLTGEEARFLSGGEFPIPVPQGLQGITIEFREFGVGLGFLPVVLGDGIINARLNVSVSELTQPAALGIQVPDALAASFVIPVLTKRSASVTVELREGQTLAIAGLINENMREFVTRFPGLGDIPILGQLFRSHEFLRNETELVILVTPYLAKPLPRNQIRLPTEGYEEPGDLGFYLLGRMADHRTGTVRPIPAGAGGTEARYGHRVQ
jgi:pilus assembly protein CpaC